MWYGYVGENTWFWIGLQLLVGESGSRSEYRLLNGRVHDPFLRFLPSTEDNAECERNRPKRPSNQQLGRNGVEDEESGSQLADMFLSNRSLLEDILKENIECRFVGLAAKPRNATFATQREMSCYCKKALLLTIVFYSSTCLALSVALNQEMSQTRTIK